MRIAHYIDQFVNSYFQGLGRGSDIERGSVSLQNVSKRFRKAGSVKKSYTTMKSDILAKFTSGHTPGGHHVEPSVDGDARILHALKDVSIEIPPGASLGLVGRNGSGKSTLLKLIAGIYQPDEGRVQVNGRISALIELGAGFHPDFTGRENVYLGGIMYGLSRAEIDERFDDIIRYAELEDFIDDPVRTYSSGMYMRLGFSLAIHTDPDILLIDEVLAVGDAAFIHRCQETISDFKRRGKTLIFVTHDLPSVVRWCDEAIWLEKGVVRDRGEPKPVIDAYLQRIEEGEQAALDVRNQEYELEREQNDSESSADGAADEALSPGSLEQKRWGNRHVEITNVKMLSNSGEAKWLFHDEDSVVIEVHFELHKVVRDLAFGVGIIRSDGLEVHGINTLIDDIDVPLPEDDAFPARGCFRYSIDRLLLREGSYFLDVAAHREDGLPYDYHHRQYSFSVRSSVGATGVFLPEHKWSFATEYAACDVPSKKRLTQNVGE